MASIFEKGGKFYGRWRSDGKERFRLLKAKSRKEAQQELGITVTMDRGNATTDQLLRGVLSAFNVECSREAEPLAILTRTLFARSDVDTIGGALVERFKTLEQEYRDRPAKLKGLAESRVYWSRAVSGAQAVKLKITEAWGAWKAAPKKHEAAPETIETAYVPLWSRFEAWSVKLGREYLHEITATDALNYMAHLKTEGMSAKSRRHARTLLAGVWKTLAIQAGLTDVWSVVPAPSSEPSARKPISADELHRLLAACRDQEEAALLALGYFCGLRLGDAATLKWEAVNLDRGFIELNPHKTQRHGVAVKIPIHPGLMKVLKSLPSVEGSEYILPKMAHTYSTSRATLSSVVRGIFRRAKIVTVEADESRIRGHSLGQFHRLRHSFVTVLAEAGAPPATIRALVGHTSAAIQKLYEHPGDAELKRAVKMLPDMEKEEGERTRG